MCQREREPFKIVTLNEDEKKFVRQHTGNIPPDTYAYCKACWKIATDKTQATQLVKGMLQIQYERAGVRNAEAMATRIQDFLVRKATQKS